MSFPEPSYKSDPMPRGWEEIVDGTGKSLFIDHVNKKTSWIDPRDNYSRVREPHELPFGWTIEYDPKIGRYLMDNIKRQATRIDPRTGKEIVQPRHVPRAFFNPVYGEAERTRPISSASSRSIASRNSRVMGSVNRNMEKVKKVWQEFEVALINYHVFYSRFLFDCRTTRLS
eukprot:m.48835 g.48835  ORF g.48835 m.48835 type:complete len:172 (+) comp10587_c0_seq2:198-713(+)